MPAHARLSSPEDCKAIMELMQRALRLDEQAVAIQPAFLHWKYWEGHPLTSTGRSYVLEGNHGIVAHGCRWPMRILTTGGSYDAFHLIDWAADSTHAGAGMQVLRDTCNNAAALFSIGGSPITRKILPALGELLRRRGDSERAPSYRVAGRVFFLSRPLKPITATMQESPVDWKMPPRILRNTYRAAWPSLHLSEGYEFRRVELQDIPDELWPRPTYDLAVTARTTELLQHFARCPVLKSPMSFILTRQSLPVAYFYLVQAGNQVRLADYGPASLDETVAQNLGAAAQLAAKRHCAGATLIAVATSEEGLRAGLLCSGFRQSYEEEIRTLVIEPALHATPQFRLTYLDCDALCL
jgi:hypothetical protein